MTEEREHPRRRAKHPPEEERHREEEHAAGPAQERFEREEPSPVREMEDAYFAMRDRICGIFELPEEFESHLRAARREILLAIRSLIDARIESLEESERRREINRPSRVHID